jgi:3-oxoacyl-(acyl-carrier-protein) synthase
MAAKPPTPIDVIEREHISLLNGGPRKISPFFIPAAIVNLAAGHVSIRYHARGPNEATCTACTSSAHSIGDAYKIISRCDADAMIAGGTECRAELFAFRMLEQCGRPEHGDDLRTGRKISEIKRSSVRRRNPKRFAIVIN